MLLALLALLRWRHKRELTPRVPNTLRYSFTLADDGDCRHRHVSERMTATRPERMVLPSFVLGFSRCRRIQPDHLLHISGERALYRSGFTPGLQAHVELRNDLRGLANWLRAHTDSRTQVIAAAHGVDYYYPVDAFFVPVFNPDFVQYSCQRGTVERWSNRPLIHDLEAMKARMLQPGRRTLLIVFVYDVDAIRSALAPLPLTTLWSDHQLIVLEAVSGTTAMNPSITATRSIRRALAEMRPFVVISTASYLVRPRAAARPFQAAARIVLRVIAVAVFSVGLRRGSAGSAPDTGCCW